MKRIYKYRIGRNLRHNGIYTISAPGQSKILSIQIQNDVVVCWVEFDAEDEGREELINLLVVYTGMNFSYQNRKSNYIATIQYFETVFHIYQLL